MTSYPIWVSNLAMDCEWESTVCNLDSIPLTLESTFCITEVKVPRAEITLSISELPNGAGWEEGGAYL